MKKTLSWLWLLGCAAALPSAAWAVPADPALAPVQHIIVIVLENHSFDNLFGQFPGAEGLDNAGKAAIQVDRKGKPYEFLPAIMDTGKYPPEPDKRFPEKLPNHPFAIEQFVSASDETGDLTHAFYEEQDQIHGGKMDRFAAVSGAGALTMGYYDGSKLQLWQYAQKYTLADHFFHAAFGGSFLNHMWLVCACTPRFDGAPDGMVTHFDKKGDMVSHGSVTDDGYAVNTVFSAQSPHPVNIKDTSKLLPPQEMPTIGDRLSEKGISWAWYSGGWDDAISGSPDRSFQFHHQPFAYFKAYANDSKARQQHLKDEKEFLRDIHNNTLPAVTFFKPLGEFNLHPGYATVASGDTHIASILSAIEKSRAWKDSVVIVTFDENGGYWDHVAPPKIDRWGPGTRVPTLIISPFARTHYVDHTVYDTTSILAFIEARYGLNPLSTRDAMANDISRSLTLHSK